MDHRHPRILTKFLSVYQAIYLSIYEAIEYQYTFYKANCFFIYLPTKQLMIFATFQAFYLFSKYYWWYVFKYLMHFLKFHLLNNNFYLGILPLSTNGLKCRERLALLVFLSKFFTTNFYNNKNYNIIFLQLLYREVKGILLSPKGFQDNFIVFGDANAQHFSRNLCRGGSL